MSVPSQESERSCICVLAASNWPLSTILMFDIGIVPTVWIFLVVHLITILSISLISLKWGVSLPWSYGSWIYNCMCNRCLSSLMLWVRITIRARCTTLCDKVCQWLATGRWFSPGNYIRLFFVVKISSVKFKNSISPFWK